MFKFPPPVEVDLMKKPYLGGYRHVCTGIEYYHGDSQTGPRPPKIPPEDTCSKLVQTNSNIEKGCQCVYSRATQMWRTDLYIPSCSDKYVISNRYVSTEELQVTFDPDEMARIIQKCWRAWRMLRFMKLVAILYRKLLEECKNLEKEKFIERKNRCLADMEALFHPRNVWDFDAIISHLERDALKKLDPEDKCRSLRLLENRCQAFLTAEARISALREDQTQRAKTKFLAHSCQPRRWINHKGQVVEMLSLKNQAALECWNLFELLYCYVDGRTDENRLEILLKARNSVEEHDCKLATQFRDLVDQEIVLIAKKVKQSKLVYLRRRIVGAFMQFVQNSHNCTCKIIDGNGCINLFDYEFREPLKKNKLFCLACRRLLPRSKFPLSVRKMQSNRCKACTRLYENLHGQIDIKPYVHILEWLKAREIEDLRLMDVLSPLDIRHLVLNTWHGRSILSENADLRQLLLPRFNLNEPWSPWNCILLTEDETEAHITLNGGESIYSAHLLKKIRLAHRTARLDFRNLVLFTTCDDNAKVEEKHLVSASRKTIKSHLSCCTVSRDIKSEVFEKEHEL